MCVQFSCDPSTLHSVGFGNSLNIFIVFVVVVFFGILRE